MRQLVVNVVNGDETFVRGWTFNAAHVMLAEKAIAVRPIARHRSHSVRNQTVRVLLFVAESVVDACPTHQRPLTIILKRHIYSNYSPIITYFKM